MTSILARIMHWRIPAAIGVVYLGIIALLTFEPIQRNLIYLHRVRLPVFPDFSHPETYGFAPGKVQSLRLKTPDGETLGAWHVLANDLYEEYVEKNGIPVSGSLPTSVFDDALSSPNSSVMLYNHGNAATRAAGNRIRVARLMVAQNINFIIYDYRGFADSTGSPSESGILTDARTVWDYLTLTKKASPHRVSIMGQSLGTGVSTGLAASLSTEGIIPKALILVAPFSSIANLLDTYRIGKIVPVWGLFKPVFERIPAFREFMLSTLKTKFDSLSTIASIRSPILILHALNDATIPPSHSLTLFNHLLSPFLTKSAEPLSTIDHKLIQAGEWGEVTTFSRGQEGGKVILGMARRGGHNEIGSGEMSVRLINEILR